MQEREFRVLDSQYSADTVHKSKDRVFAWGHVERQRTARASAGVTGGVMAVMVVRSLHQGDWTLALTLTLIAVVLVLAELYLLPRMSRAVQPRLIVGEHLIQFFYGEQLQWNVSRRRLQRITLERPKRFWKIALHYPEIRLYQQSKHFASIQIPDLSEASVLHQQLVERLGPAFDDE